MKALSMIQPWCSLVARRQKPIETRTWRTKHRGDLLFTAGMLGAPRGVALCVARLVDVRPMTLDDVHGACMDFVPEKDWPELIDGRFAWVLEDVRDIEPFPVKGQLGLFNVDDALIRFRGAA